MNDAPRPDLVEARFFRRPALPAVDGTNPPLTRFESQRELERRALQAKQILSSDMGFVSEKHFDVNI